MKIIDVITSSLSLIFLEIFLKISGNIKCPENSRPYVYQTVLVHVTCQLPTCPTTEYLLVLYEKSCVWTMIGRLTSTPSDSSQWIFVAKIERNDYLQHSVIYTV